MPDSRRSWLGEPDGLALGEIDGEPLGIDVLGELLGLTLGLKDGLVDGNIFTQDAIISGSVLGSVHAQSRLELQPTSQISGEIQARRLQLEEGASVEGQLSVGEAPPASRPEATTRPDAKDGPGRVPAQSGKPNPSTQGDPGQAAAAPPQGGVHPGNQPPPRPQT